MKRSDNVELIVPDDGIADDVARAVIDELIVPALVEKFIEAKLKLLALSEHNGDQS